MAVRSSQPAPAWPRRNSFAFLMSRPPRQVFKTSTVVLALITTGLFLAACGGGSKGSETSAGQVTGASTAGGREGVPSFGHVFLIVGENTSANQVTAARAPYLTSSS